VLNLGTSGNHDGVKVALLLLGDVGTLEGTLTTLGGRESGVLVKVLTREDEDSGAVLAGDRRGKGSDGLLGVSRAEDVDVGEGTEAGDSLDRLMGGTILSDTD